MPRVELLETSIRKGILPPICVITGGQENISFQPALVPSRDGSHRRLVLPFADLPFKRWQAAKLLYRVSITLAVVQFFGACFLAMVNGPMSILIFLAGCALPLCTYWGMLRGSGPEVLAASRGALILDIPNSDAAVQLQEAADEHEALVASAAGGVLPRQDSNSEAKIDSQ